MHRPTRKHVLTALLVLVATAGLSVGVWYWWNHRPLPLPTTAQEAVDHLGTSRYRNLPDYRQAEYREQAWRLIEQMPPEQRRKLMEDPAVRDRLGSTRRDMMEGRLRQYMLADAATRAQLDAEAQQRMQQFRERNPDRSGPPGPAGPPGESRGDGPPPDWRSRVRGFIEDRFESGNPQLNGWRSEFFRHRREQREKSNPQPK